MDLIEGLQNKNNKEAYQLLLQLEEKSSQSDELYTYFEAFVKLLKSSNSYVRTRGFRLACAQAQWDTEHKLEACLDELLLMLDDKKPTVVRQSLAALHLVVLYRPELSERIEKKLNSMDLYQYKDSMSPLIRKDIEELKKIM